MHQVRLHFLRIITYSTSERHTQASDTPTPKSQLFPLPTRVSPRAIMPTPCNENQINLALRALERTPFLSLRRAASIYKVPIKTWSRRKNGVQARRDIIPKTRKLSDLEEITILERILELDLQVFPPRLRGVEEMANRLLWDRDAKPIGKNWTSNFISRHPQLKTAFSRIYDYQRALCGDPDTINAWFHLVRNFTAKYGIVDEDIYNFDETGFFNGPNLYN